VKRWIKKVKPYEIPLVMGADATEYFRGGVGECTRSDADPHSYLDSDDNVDPNGDLDSDRDLDSNSNVDRDLDSGDSDGGGHATGDCNYPSADSPDGCASTSRHDQCTPRNLDPAGDTIDPVLWLATLPEYPFYCSDWQLGDSE
jgi:hypothetical protein